MKRRASLGRRGPAPASSTAEGAGTTAPPKKLPKGQQPLDVFRALWKEVERLFTTDEKALVSSIVIASDKLGMVDRDDRPSLDKLSDRTSIKTRQAVAGLLHVVAGKAGIIDVIPVPRPGSKESERNKYRLRPDKLLGWVKHVRAGGKRPVDWGGVPADREKAEPPPVYRAALEELRAAAGLDKTDPDVKKALAAAEKADRVRHQLGITAGRLAAEQRRLEERQRDYDGGAKAEAEAALATLRTRAGKAGAPPAAAPAPATSTASSPPRSTPATAPTTTSSSPIRPPAPPGPATAQSVAAPSSPRPGSAELAPPPPPRSEGERGPRAPLTALEREFDAHVLAVVRRYPLLASLATAKNAAMIGLSARNAKRPPEQAEEALATLNFKIWHGDYPGLDDLGRLKLARGFVATQWPSVHAPIPAADVLDAVRPAGPPEPTPEDLAVMHAELGVSDDDVADGRARYAAGAAAAALFEEAIALTRRVSPASFAQWFAGVQYDGLADGVVSLTAQNGYVQTWVDKNFAPTLCHALRELTKRPTAIRWTIDAHIDAPIAALAPPAPPAPRAPRGPSRPSTRPST